MSPSAMPALKLLETLKGQVLQAAIIAMTNQQCALMRSVAFQLKLHELPDLADHDLSFLSPVISLALGLQALLFLSLARSSSAHLLYIPSNPLSKSLAWQTMTKPVRTFALTATAGGWEVQERHNTPSGVQFEHCSGSGVFSSLLQPTSPPGDELQQRSQNVS